MDEPATDPFATLLGERRGAANSDLIDAEHPSASARQACATLCRSVRHMGALDEALWLLRANARRYPRPPLFDDVFEAVSYRLASDAAVRHGSHCTQALRALGLPLDPAHPGELPAEEVARVLALSDEQAKTALSGAVADARLSTAALRESTNKAMLCAFAQVAGEAMHAGGEPLIVMALMDRYEHWCERLGQALGEVLLAEDWSKALRFYYLPEYRRTDPLTALRTFRDGLGTLACRRAGKRAYGPPHSAPDSP